ncbi:MAG: hypothetical protein IPL09_01250 [Bacteroidetes bacterium]|nr:hypothetical protein [Bacteroidota bacterium]HQW45626.1 hypothetical protein [Chitinophagaceae bacterium]
MKKIIIASILILSFQSMQAQERASKLMLVKGQKIKIKSIDTSDIKQKRGEESMDMKTLSNAETEMVVLEVKENGYLATTSLKKINVDFEGFGQKMQYDSENPGKQEGMMAEQLKNAINKLDTIQLDFEGKKIEDEEGDDPKKGRGKGGRGGMMRMMNQAGTNVENAFLLIPAEAKEGNGWKKDATKDGMRTQTIYFVEKIDGPIAIVSFKKKTKGTITRSGGQGGEMKIESDNLSNGMITVDMTSGVVKSYTETTNTNSKTNMMGQDMPSTGTVISHIVFE